MIDDHIRTCSCVYQIYLWAETFICIVTWEGGLDFFAQHMELSRVMIFWNWTINKKVMAHQRFLQISYGVTLRIPKCPWYLRFYNIQKWNHVFDFNMIALTIPAHLITPKSTAWRWPYIFIFEFKGKFCWGQLCCMVVCCFIRSRQVSPHAQRAAWLLLTVLLTALQGPQLLCVNSERNESLGRIFNARNYVWFWVLS